MVTEDPASQAEKILRSHWTATQLVSALGCELAEDREPPPGSPLHALRKLAARYDRGELSWGDYLIAAREVLPGPAD